MVLEGFDYPKATCAAASRILKKQRLKTLSDVTWTIKVEKVL